MPRDAICIATPGIDPAPAARGSGAQTPHILAVGSLIARKDHATLIEALRQLRGSSWTASIVGSDRADPATADALRRQVQAAGLADRIAIPGALDDLSAEYDRADIFALASRYEGYGMVFAEAMARGLPIVGCRGGAIAEVVPKTAGLLVEPGDAAAFAAALRAMLDKPEQRRSLSDGGRAAARHMPTWPQVAEIVSERLAGVQ